MCGPPHGPDHEAWAAPTRGERTGGNAHPRVGAAHCGRASPTDRDAGRHTALITGLGGPYTWGQGRGSNAHPHVGAAHRGRASPTEENLRAATPFDLSTAARGRPRGLPSRGDRAQGRRPDPAWAAPTRGERTGHHSHHAWGQDRRQLSPTRRRGPSWPRVTTTDEICGPPHGLNRGPGRPLQVGREIGPPLLARRSARRGRPAARRYARVAAPLDLLGPARGRPELRRGATGLRAGGLDRRAWAAPTQWGRRMGHHVLQRTPTRGGRIERLLSCPRRRGPSWLRVQALRDRETAGRHTFLIPAPGADPTRGGRGPAGSSHPRVGAAHCGRASGQRRRRGPPHWPELRTRAAPTRGEGDWAPLLQRLRRVGAARAAHLSRGWRPVHSPSRPGRNSGGQHCRSRPRRPLHVGDEDRAALSPTRGGGSGETLTHV